MDGKAKRVTSTPFRLPHTAPMASATNSRPSGGTPWWCAKPIATDDSAKVPETEISISRQMISKAIGSAIRAFSLKLKVLSARL